MYGSSLWGSEHADKGHSQQITNLGWCRLPRHPIANLCDADVEQLTPADLAALQAVPAGACTSAAHQAVGHVETVVEVAHPEDVVGADDAALLAPLPCRIRATHRLRI